MSWRNLVFGDGMELFAEVDGIRLVRSCGLEVRLSWEEVDRVLEAVGSIDRSLAEWHGTEGKCSPVGSG